MPLQLSAATQLTSRNRAAFPGSQKIGAGAQTRIDCRGSNVPQIILFEIHKVICLAFFVRHGVSKEIYFSSADGPSEQIGIIAAPPLLGLVHDLTDGYAALWACVVVILGAVYAVTRIAGE